ncbi:MAG TPA: DNA-binding domain-containing protein [Polyangiaceae bacterium]|nr:DNA-binding domain-containing protein [Polyangiaceae bacterium]
MSWPASPAWLLELEAAFGQMLRAPLSRATGTLRAETSAYPLELLAQAKPYGGLGQAERLAVYHRQYWFRLFTLLQRAFPLTAELTGFWRFNELASDFLVARPPRGWDIDRVGDGFAEFLSETLPDAELELHSPRVSLPRAALVEAARIDAAYHDVFGAPPVTPYAPALDDAARLLQGTLRLSPAVALLTESWPLCELRRRLLGSQPLGGPLVLGPRLSAPRSWLLGRDGLKLGLLELEPREAQLLGLLSQHPVGIALARLEAECLEAERQQLPELVQTWLARSVRLGIWVGLDVES